MWGPERDTPHKAVGDSYGRPIALCRPLAESVFTKTVASWPPNDDDGGSMSCIAVQALADRRHPRAFSRPANAWQSLASTGSAIPNKSAAARESGKQEIARPEADPRSRLACSMAPCLVPPQSRLRELRRAGNRFAHPLASTSSVHGAGSAFVLLLPSPPVRPLCSRCFVYNLRYITMPGACLCRLSSTI
jgi:hypothetical protein